MVETIKDKDFTLPSTVLRSFSFSPKRCGDPWGMKTLKQSNFPLFWSRTHGRLFFTYLKEKRSDEIIILPSNRVNYISAKHAIITAQKNWERNLHAESISPPASFAYQRCQNFFFEEKTPLSCRNVCSQPVQFNPLEFMVVLFDNNNARTHTG